MTNFADEQLLWYREVITKSDAFIAVYSICVVRNSLKKENSEKNVLLLWGVRREAVFRICTYLHVLML